MIDLYSTGCPKCRILEEKLNKEGFSYQKHTDVDEMVSLGLTSAPALRVGREMMNYDQALMWLKNSKAEE